MAKKQPGRHLRFYMDCIEKKEMPRCGLCSCAWSGYIDVELLNLFTPYNCSVFSYWAAGRVANPDTFTQLRQTIVLFMAAINNEL